MIVDLPFRRVIIDQVLYPVFQGSDWKLMLRRHEHRLTGRMEVETIQMTMHIR